MPGEKIGELNPQDVPQGEKWLAMLGPEYLALKDETTKYSIEGSPVLVKDFHRLCEGPARAVFIGLETGNPADPEYVEELEAARFLFNHHFLKLDEE